MVPSKTYLKFKETRSQEDLETLNKYLNRLNEISSKLNDDALELSAEEENKLYDEDEDLTDKVLRLLFGDTFFIFISEYSLDGYDSWEDTVEDLMEDLCTHQETLEDLGNITPMKPNIILILIMGGNILIMGASSHPTSEEPLTYENTLIA